MIRVLAITALVVWLNSPGLSVAQQVADPGFQPKLTKPAYAKATGPVVALDEAHQNFHTRDGRYAPFSRLLGADGYQVNQNQKTFENGIDATIKVLVIANALHPSDSKEWKLPNPSAFTHEEVDAIEAWVKKGGSLFLIADHMPFPGAASELAKRFGLEMANGFAFASDAKGELNRGPMVFKRDAGELGDHPIINGQTTDQKISQVASFTGQAFRWPNNENGWSGLLKLPVGTVSLEPETAWQFNKETKRRDVSGWFQGACAKIGKGRIVVFGEAAMFTSQRSGKDGKNTSGFTAEIAKDNQQLLLNILHWLTEKQDHK